MLRINLSTFAPHLTITLLKNFSDLGLSEPILKALPELGLETPSEIQEQAIPILVEGIGDFIGLAQTGTGKTAAFGLPLLDVVDVNAKHTQALILAPTRELGQQIAVQMHAFSKYVKGMNIQVVYGGANIVGQINALKKAPQVIIATPGRLIDLAKRKALKLDKIEYVVLDEADEMLNMGFKEELNKILEFTPDDKATWLFSATMPNEIRSIISEYMDDPQEVAVARKNIVNTNIDHQYIIAGMREKTSALRRILDSQTDMKGVMFCRTKMTTQKLANELGANGYRVEALHGDLSQNQRDMVMRRFRADGLQLLLATDVAARGIDVNDLTHVIHHTLPDQMEYYTHRSGRTARAGKKGISLTLASKGELKKIKTLEKRLKISFTEAKLPTVAELKTQRVIQWAEKVNSLAIAPRLDAQMLEQVSTVLADLDKDVLIQKLVSKELEQLVYKEFEAEPSSGRGDRSDRGSKRKEGRGSSSGSGGNLRYFINVGEMDNMGKKDLVEFISGEVDVKKGDIENISLQRRCAYFEVAKKHAETIDLGFKGVSLEGREIRVNIESGGSDKGKRSSRGDRSDRNRRDRRSGGGGRRDGNRGGGKSRGKRRGQGGGGW